MVHTVIVCGVVWCVCVWLCARVSFQNEVCGVCVCRVVFVIGEVTCFSKVGLILSVVCSCVWVCWVSCSCSCSCACIGTLHVSKLCLNGGLGSGEFTGSWMEQQSRFSKVQSHKTNATDVKPTNTRRNAKPDDCAGPLKIHHHLSTTQRGNWLAGGTHARSQLPDQSGTTAHSKPHGGQIRRANWWVRRAHPFADLKLTFLSSPPAKLRFATHTPTIHRKIRTELDGRMVGTLLERPARLWERETWHCGPRW